MSNSEIEILIYGLKQGLQIHPKESEMVFIMKYIYEKILRHNARYISQAIFHKRDLKLLWKHYFDIDDKRYIHDSLRELREKFIILKPDKGQGIVLVDHGEYANSVPKIFDDASLPKFLTQTKLTNTCI